MLNKRKLIFGACVLAAAGAGAGPACAADAIYRFTGQIQSSSCAVDSTTMNQTINLATVSASDFAGAGATSSPKAFVLKLTDCAAGTPVSITLTGQADSNATVLKNGGSAGQIGVQLLKAASEGGTTGTPITLNAKTAVGAADASGDMTIPMVAQYYRLGSAPMTAGTVTATATVNFTYN